MSHVYDREGDRGRLLEPFCFCTGGAVAHIEVA